MPFHQFARRTSTALPSLSLDPDAETMSSLTLAKQKSLFQQCLQWCLLPLDTMSVMVSFEAMITEMVKTLRNGDFRNWAAAGCDGESENSFHSHSLAGPFYCLLYCILLHCGSNI